jgi:hypothetical protein
MRAERTSPDTALPHTDYIASPIAKNAHWE